MSARPGIVTVTTLTGLTLDVVAERISATTRVTSQGETFEAYTELQAIGCRPVAVRDLPDDIWAARDAALEALHRRDLDAAIAVAALIPRRSEPYPKAVGPGGG